MATQDWWKDYDPAYTTGDPLGIVTPDPRRTCSVAKFGRPHFWMTGAFYIGGRLIESDDYVICGNCGQVEYEGDESQ